MSRSILSLICSLYLAKPGALESTIGGSFKDVWEACEVNVKKKGLRMFLEEFVMTYAVFKWLMLAVLSGILVGGAVSLFVKLLEFGIHVTGGLPAMAQKALLPFGLVASALMVHYLAPDASGHGTEKVVEAVHERSGQIDVKVVPVKMITTIVTVAAGGSVGKEGPATQIAAGITSTLAGLLKLNDEDKKKLVICGVSAGFAAVFGTPVSGAIFALEVLFIGQIYYDVLFPSFISGVVAWRVANALGIVYSVYPVQENLPAFSVSTFLWTVLAGAFFGLVSLCFVEIITFCEKWFHHLKLPLAAKALLGAGLILATAFCVGDLYFGLGDGVVESLLHGGSVPPLAFFWKIIITSLTLSCGGSGGVVTPIFFMGAASGAAFATFFGLNTVAYASWGLAGVLAGCANAPIASTIMAIELFGAQAAPFAAVVSVTSFMVVGHRSVYPSQLLSRSKSTLLEVREPGLRIDIDETSPVPGRSPVIHKVTDAIGRRWQSVRKKKRP